MRIEQSNLGTRVVLSRRNLLALLTKLDIQGSMRTIYTEGLYGEPFMVSSEENDVHYGGRAVPPGEMHPLTESTIKWLEQGEKEKDD